MRLESLQERYRRSFCDSSATSVSLSTFLRSFNIVCRILAPIYSVLCRTYKPTPNIPPVKVKHSPMNPKISPPTVLFLINDAKAIATPDKNEATAVAYCVTSFQLFISLYGEMHFTLFTSIPYDRIQLINSGS